MLVAVAKNRHAYGVDCDRDDWRFRPGDPRNCREMRSGRVGVAATYDVLDLDRALGAEYASDAHLVPYIVRDHEGRALERQPRINKQGLPFVRSLGFSVSLEVLFADIDNPAHSPWTDELFALAREQDRALATAGVYYTDHGRRIWQPLEQPVPVDDAEGVIYAWLLDLERLGIAGVDKSCRDWTRHYRLPHVRRPGRPLARARVFDGRLATPIQAPAPAAVNGARQRRTGSVDVLGNASDAPLVRAFGAAGWLGPELGRGKRAALCPWRANHSIGRDFDSSTVLFGSSARYPHGFFHCSHGHCAHRTQADVLEALPPEARALVPRDRSSAPPAARKTLPVDEARARLENAFRRAQDGLNVVIAGCGTGKTQAALAVAVERANAPGKPDAQRRPAHSVTVISVPTNRLAQEIAARAATLGLESRRIFGPLSVKTEDGDPECRIHTQARLLSVGGLSVPWELCEGRGVAPCQYADTCKARGGAVGPDDARLVIGPHALMGRLVSEAGSTGLMVIDEPPALICHHVVTIQNISEALSVMSVRFEWRYYAALAPAISAIGQWISTAPIGEPVPLDRALAVVDTVLMTQASQATGAHTALEAALAAPDDPKRPTPPVKPAEMSGARTSPGAAKAIGEAARVALLVWWALAHLDEAVARVEERSGRRVLVLTMPDTGFRAALKRPGQVVVADAGGRMHLPVYERVVGYGLEANGRVTEAHAADGAPVERTMLRRRATRAAWLHHGRLVVSDELVRVVEQVVAWVCEDRPERWALVTFKALAEAMRGALDPAYVPEKGWEDAGVTAEALDEARRRLGPVLMRCGAPDVGHYGALRGLDHWKGHDALVTLGDPWGQLGDVQHETELVSRVRGADLGTWESRFEAAVRSELEQAHGRLRLVHRTKPARALHVGMVVPGGWDIGRFEVRGGPGRPRVGPSKAQIAAAVEAHGSVSAAAKALGISRGMAIRGGG